MAGIVYKLFREFPSCLDMISYETENLHENLEIYQKYYLFPGLISRNKTLEQRPKITQKKISKLISSVHFCLIFLLCSVYFIQIMIPISIFRASSNRLFRQWHCTTSFYLPRKYHSAFALSSNKAFRNSSILNVQLSYYFIISCLQL